MAFRINVVVQLIRRPSVRKPCNPGLSPRIGMPTASMSPPNGTRTSSPRNWSRATPSSSATSPAFSLPGKTGKSATRPSTFPLRPPLTRWAAPQPGLTLPLLERSPGFSSATPAAAEGVLAFPLHSLGGISGHALWRQPGAEPQPRSTACWPRSGLTCARLPSKRYSPNPIAGTASSM